MAHMDKVRCMLGGCTVLLAPLRQERPHCDARVVGDQRGRGHALLLRPRTVAARRPAFPSPGRSSDLALHDAAYGPTRARRVDGGGTGRRRGGGRSAAAAAQQLRDDEQGEGASAALLLLAEQATCEKSHMHAATDLIDFNYYYYHPACRLTTSTPATAKGRGRSTSWWDAELVDPTTPGANWHLTQQLELCGRCCPRRLSVVRSHLSARVGRAPTAVDRPAGRRGAGPRRCHLRLRQHVRRPVPSTRRRGVRGGGHSRVP